MKRAAWLNGTKIDRKINASQCTICGSDGICGHLIKQTIANNNGDVFARPIAVADITQARRMIHGQDQDRISPYIPSAVAGRQNQESTDHRSSPYSPGFYEQIAMRATEHAQAQIQMRAHAQTQIQAQIQDPAVSGPVSPGMVFRH